jgi:hypothetical protein
MRPRPRCFGSATTLVLASLGVAGPIVAQQHEHVSARLLAEPYADPEATIALATEMLAAASTDASLHLTIAREATALGVVSESKELRIEWLVRAHEAATAAFALDSTNVDANYWLAASLGLRADEEGGRTKISLARQTHARTLRTLELDSLHPGANHVMGRLHAGAKRLGWLNRVIARTLGFGEILDAASWRAAEQYMRISAERDPEQLVNLYELGKLLVERADELDVDPDDGLSILRDVAARRPRHALDSVYVARSRDVLAGFERR